jgi:hypothetical protein
MYAKKGLIFPEDIVDKTKTLDYSLQLDMSEVRIHLYFMDFHKFSAAMGYHIRQSWLDIGMKQTRLILNFIPQFSQTLL